MIETMGLRPLGAATIACLCIVASCSASYSVKNNDADAAVVDGVDAQAMPDTDAGVSADSGQSTMMVDASTDARTDAGCSMDLQTDAKNCGVCGRICNTGGCVGGECLHVAFVTPVANAGDIGGIAGADTLCQTAAMNAGLHGKFLAWLATPATSPNARFFRATRAYVLPLGTVIAGNYTELTNPPIKAAVGYDASGALSPITKAWSNVSNDGTYNPGDGNACANWTSSSAGDRGSWGNAQGNGNGWSNSSSDSCNTAAHGIYCFEQ